MTNKSTVSLQSLCHAIQTMGEKLTHLYLAHNKLAGVPQIVTALSVRLHARIQSSDSIIRPSQHMTLHSCILFLLLQTYCPNLILLDLSNVSTIAASHGFLHIEKLQQGCQKLKVLRITNSHITLSPATLQEQVTYLFLPFTSGNHFLFHLNCVRWTHRAFRIWKNYQSHRWLMSRD